MGQSARLNTAPPYARRHGGPGRRYYARLEYLVILRVLIHIDTRVHCTTLSDFRKSCYAHLVAAACIFTSTECS
jgi:hypothetical protein